ncbi:Unknown protein sequence [Pseudomonas syringae pv. aceris]|nr:Unknown protein sequence [Pseudomonas syringae pv. aceris]
MQQLRNAALLENMLGTSLQPQALLISKRSASAFDGRVLPR